MALLPGLGEFLSPADLQLVLCKRCGLLRFFAERAVLDKLGAGDWRKLPALDTSVAPK